MVMALPRIFARIEKYKPTVYEDKGLMIKGFSVEDLDWREVVVRVSRERLLNRMITEASRLAYEYKTNNNYVFAIIEAPGLVVVEGEGDVEGYETILSPIPARLIKIIFYKKEEDGDRLKIVKEVSIPEQLYILDGLISLTESIEYDLVELVTDKGSRLMLREELYIPVVSKLAVKTAARKKTKKPKRKRRKKTAKKSSKKKTKKKTRRSKKRKRKKKSRRSRKK